MRLDQNPVNQTLSTQLSVMQVEKKNITGSDDHVLRRQMGHIHDWRYTVPFVSPANDW